MTDNPLDRPRPSLELIRAVRKENRKDNAGGHIIEEPTFDRNEILYPETGMPSKNQLVNWQNYDWSGFEKNLEEFDRVKVLHEFLISLTRTPLIALIITSIQSDRVADIDMQIHNYYHNLKPATKARYRLPVQIPSAVVSIIKEAAINPKRSLKLLNFLLEVAEEAEKRELGKLEGKNFVTL